MSAKKINYRWRGLSGHFIGAHKCIFRLCTDVGDYRISTIGAYYIDNKMNEIGLGRHYETFVFEIKDNLNDRDELIILLEIDSEGINVNDFKSPFEADEAAEKMHIDMCLKYELMQTGEL